MTSKELGILYDTCKIEPQDVERHQEEAEENNCPICYETIDEVCINIELPGCKHQFHRGCINAWLEKNLSCPLCKVNVRMELLKRSFSKPMSPRQLGLFNRARL